MARKFSWKFIVLFLLISLWSGCGYSTKSTLPGHLKTIHIKPIENKIDYTSESLRNIYLPLLEIDVRNEIVDRFLFNGALRIAEADQADLVLTAKLLNYQRSGLRYTESDDIEEYRVSIIVSVEVYDTRKQKMLWRESRFAGEGTYFVTGPEASTEEAAVEEAKEDLARRIVERTVEYW